MAPTVPAPLVQGLTVMGIQTGIDPMLALAGLAGGWWQQTYLDKPLPILQRLSIGCISALAGTWFGPLAASMAHSAGAYYIPWWPAEVHSNFLRFAMAYSIGLVAHRKLGPLLLRTIDRKAAEVAP
jgi:hypothetical protein